MAATSTISTFLRPAVPYTVGSTCVSGPEIVGFAQAAAEMGRALLRSFSVPSPQNALTERASVPTAVSEAAPFPIGQNRAAKALAREIAEYRDLREGWDGEGALAPNSDAICDAARFVYEAGKTPGLVPRLEASLNADGTVALDVDGDPVGTLVFKGDDTVVHALQGHPPGVVDFPDDAIPPELLRALIR